MTHFFLLDLTGICLVKFVLLLLADSPLIVLIDCVFISAAVAAATTAATVAAATVAAASTSDTAAFCRATTT